MNKATKAYLTGIATGMMLMVIMQLIVIYFNK